LTKLLIFMKLSTFLLLINFTCIAATGYSQTEKVSIKLKNGSLKELFSAVEQQTSYKFLYRDDAVENILVNLDEVDEPLDNVLTRILNGSKFMYKILPNDLIVIAPSELLRQQKVSGTVTDEKTGIPLPGVTVFVEGTNKGTVTDNNGKYTIEVSNKESLITFSYVGYNTTKIPFDGKYIIDVLLTENVQTLEEVVVIGYGTMKKSDLTGSVGSITKENIGDRLVVTGIGGMIQGKVAGVDVSAGKIRIRGVTTLNSTDPLVVIDGFLGGSMSTVNPDDIESIEVLKDASSTAIYGSRGANGVILVNTKNGKTGPLKININAYSGISKPSRRLDLLNASQYTDYAIDALQGAGMPVNSKFYSPDIRVDRTDWQDAVTRTVPVGEFDVNLSGGSENSTFYLSLGYKHSEKVYLNPSNDQANIRLKNKFNVKKWFKAGDNISLMYDYSKGNDFAADGPKGAWPFWSAVPYMQVKDANNYWGYSITDRELSGDAQNPVTYSALSDPQTNALSYQANLWADIEPFKGLVYHIQTGITGSFSRYTRWNDQYQNEINTRVPSDYTETSTYGIYPILESYLTYSHKFGSHDLTTMIGNTWQNYARSGGIGIYGQDFDLSTVRNVFMAKTRSVLNENYAQYAYLSYFGRLNYQYNDRYLLTVNIRRDGSPRFAPVNRWGTFPSVAVAWKLSEENFIKNLNFFYMLKLRASWGISGNDAIGDFRYLSQVWTNGVYYPLGSPVSAIPGASVVTDASQDIKWESTTSKAVGVDMGFLKNALSVTAEYFIKNTDDILFAVPRASSLGYGLVEAGDAIINAASCNNKGFELQVGYRNNIGALHYSFNANYTNVSNEVTGLGLGQPYLYDTFNRTAIGYPIGYIYGYVAQGLFMTQAELDEANQGARDAALALNPALTDEDLASIYYQYVNTAPGDVKFKDINGDGKVTDTDRTNIGNPIPKHTFGFSIDLEFKGFDLNAFFQGISGSDLYNYSYGLSRNMARLINQETWVQDRWRSEDEPGNGIVPRAVIGDPTSNWRPSTLYVSPGDYLKLKQLSIGYTFPNKIISRMGLTNLRIYASGYNLLTFTKYKWYDPEIASDNLYRAADYNEYPTARTITFGIQLGL
jgi:TonB-dependent starch-binding outer membrane protein SusC